MSCTCTLPPTHTDTHTQATMKSKPHGWLAAQAAELQWAQQHAARESARATRPAQKLLLAGRFNTPALSLGWEFALGAGRLLDEVQGVLGGVLAVGLPRGSCCTRGPEIYSWTAALLGKPSHAAAQLAEPRQARSCVWTVSPGSSAPVAKKTPTDRTMVDLTFARRLRRTRVKNKFVG